LVGAAVRGLDCTREPRGSHAVPEPPRLPRPHRPRTLSTTSPRTKRTRWTSWRRWRRWIQWELCGRRSRGSPGRPRALVSAPNPLCERALLGGRWDGEGVGFGTVRGRCPQPRCKILSNSLNHAQTRCRMEQRDEWYKQAELAEEGEGDDDEYDCIGRATMKAQSEAFVQVMGAAAGGRGRGRGAGALSSRLQRGGGAPGRGGQALPPPGRGAGRVSG